MIDIKLDPITNDLVVINGDIVLIDGIESIAQGLRIRLAVIDGEWFRDNSIGIVSLRDDKPDWTDVSSKVRAEIMKEDGVTSIVSFSSIFNANTRVLSIKFVAMTIYGELKLTEGVNV